MQTPSNGVTHELLVHGMKQGLTGVAIGEVAEPASAGLADPTCCGRFAVVGAAPEQVVDALLVVRGRVLLVGDEETAHTTGDRMIRVDDLDPEPLQRAVADVAASNEIEVGTVLGIQCQGVVNVNKPSTPFDERDDRALLLGRHPGEIRTRVALRALEAVAENDQELDLRQVLRRQGPDVHGEVGNHAGRLEDGLQTFLDVPGFVGLVADQDQRVRSAIRRSRGAAVKSATGTVSSR